MTNDTDADVTLDPRTAPDAIGPAGDVVARLARALAEGTDDEADDAALALGLLVERELGAADGRDPARLDEKMRSVLGDALAGRRLDPGEVARAVEELLAYVDGRPRPRSRAAWALARTRDPRRVEVLLALFDRTVTDPAAEHTACHALNGIADIDDDRVRAAMARAAVEGCGAARDTAERWLRRHRR